MKRRVTQAELLDLHKRVISDMKESPQYSMGPPNDLLSAIRVIIGWYVIRDGNSPFGKFRLPEPSRN